MRATHRPSSLPSARSRALTVGPALAIALLSIAASLSAQAPQWRSFSSSADRFQALFPVEPQVSKNSVPVGNDTFELRSYEADTGSSSLYVGVCDYGAKGAAANPDEMLTSAKKGAVDHMSAHILAEKKITLGSSPGVEFQAENDNLHFTARMYMAGGVLYQTMVATPLNEKFADTARFLDAFELLPSNGPAATAGPDAGPASLAAADWKQYRYAGDGFTAWFPSPPALQDQKINTEGGLVDLRTYVVENTSGTLIAAVCDYGAAAAGKDPDVLLEDARNGAVDNLKGHLASEKKIALGAYHGIEFEADSDAAHVSVRIYLAGTTLYQMIAASPANARSADTARFLDSFQLIPPRAAH
jgi:hypothetical protein